MKKILVFMAIIATAATLCVGCKSDSKKDPQETINNLTGGDWQGYISGYKKNGSQWDFNKERNYVILHFERTGELNGTGRQLEFDNEYMREQTGYAEFNWRMTDDKIQISYSEQGWNDVYFEYNNCVIDGSQFKGDMFDYFDHKYVFELYKTTFTDWSKYNK